MKQFKIQRTIVTLENLGENQGRITIGNQYSKIYEMYWGSMGGTLEEFLLRINSDYFANKLLGVHSMYVFDSKKTFKELRRFIREDLDLPWYKHQEFQKRLRESINLFQEHCTSDDYFISHFSWYLNHRLDYHLIENRWERDRIEKDFNNITEPWHFIQQKESDETKWLKNLHKKIQNKISKI